MSFREKIKARLSKERGTVYKDPGGKISICLIYPNTYYVGMSNLGFQGIYGLINARPDSLAERAFLPDDEDLEECLRKNQVLYSYELMRALTEFHVLAFSVSFENDYPNILKILKLAHIPIKQKDRTERDPLIVGGGIALSSNPEPVAPFFDIVMLGDGEVLIPEFIEALKESGRDKKRLFNILKLKEGFYIPSMYDIEYDNEGRILKRTSTVTFATNQEGFPEKIKRAFLKDLNKGVRFSILTPETEFSDMHLIEVMRGCPWRCHFCLTGNFIPLRTRSFESLLREIKESPTITFGNTPRFGIIGSSLTDYRYIKEVLQIEGVELSITSLRATQKSAEIIGLLKGKRSVSIAPEAGSERLRQIINKQVKEEDILLTSELVFKQGIEKLRLYFMVGLPEETDDDAIAIVDLVKKVRALSKKGFISLSISIFVPKPHTPFERYPMERPENIKKRLNIIKKAFRAEETIRVFHEIPKYAYMQGLFSLGSRRVSEVLEELSSTVTFATKSWVVEDWQKACSKRNIKPEFYIFRQKPVDEVLPWDFIE
jgi:radical SAM superfamily enzyme YgiQ (UPF0313 family)